MKSIDIACFAKISCKKLRALSYLDKTSSSLNHNGNLNKVTHVRIKENKERLEQLQIEITSSQVSHDLVFDVW